MTPPNKKLHDRPPIQPKANFGKHCTLRFPIKLNKYFSLLPEQKPDNQLNHGDFYLLFVSMKTRRHERKQTKC